MKRFDEPKIDVFSFVLEDVITASSDFEGVETIPTLPVVGGPNETPIG